MGARLVSIMAKPEKGDKVRPIIEQTGNGELLCYESTSGRWFRSSEESVKNELEWLNKKCEDNEYDTIGVDELFRSLKLYSINQYCNYGWRLNTAPFRSPIFKYKLYLNGYLDMEEPVLCIYTIIPAVKDYYKEEV